MGETISAMAGTLESNDILITISKGSGNTVIDLSSIVMEQFGESIRATIEQCLKSAGIGAVEVKAQDKGALECTIKARTETAIARYKEKI